MAPEVSESTATTVEAPARRWHDLDALRGFAMLLGIGLHAALAFFPLFWPVQDRHASFDGPFDEFVVAVHGFRMPLFFLLSGFFTTMLWRRRGLGALVWHRVRRIGLPLALGMITVVPAIDWVSERAFESATPVTATVIGGDGRWEVSAALEAGSRGDIWTPIFLNQPGGVDQAIEAGADVNTRGDDDWTPLHLAAVMDQPSSVDSLLAAGADPEPLTIKGETPLVLAVWAGSADSADLLVAYGAADLRWSEEPQWEDLSWFGVGADSKAGEAERSSAEDDIGLESWVDQFHHLWFLWFLCWLVAGFALLAPLVARAGQLIGNPAVRRRLLWLLVPVTYPLQLAMGGGGDWPTFGPDTSTGLLPTAHVLAYYAAFFAFGALTHDATTDDGEPLIDRIGRRWPIVLPVTLILVLPVGLGFTYEGGQWWAACLLQVVFVWGMSFGLIGLFRRVFATERRGVRYLSDASYWMYVVHLPLIMAAQWLVRDWSVPAIPKFVLVCAAVSALLLATYRAFVRYTPIGTMLNGPRTRHPPAGPSLSSG